MNASQEPSRLRCAQLRRPTDGGQRRENARAGHNAGQERKSVKHGLFLPSPVAVLATPANEIYLAPVESGYAFTRT